MLRISNQPLEPTGWLAKAETAIEKIVIRRAPRADFSTASTSYSNYITPHGLHCTTAAHLSQVLGSFLELLLRNLHAWFAAGLGFLIAGFAFAVLRIALAESLWLDELHTSWAVSGRWREIATRAAAGNQTPLYFWLVALLTQTLGQRPEWVLRLPSVAAWLLAIILVGLQVRSKISSRGSQGWLLPLCIVAWVVLDEQQWFYASEARPYAFVQLVSLAGWCCVQALVQTENRPKRIQTLMAVWCFLSVANIYLHLTAAFPVLFQWLAGVAIVWRKRNQRYRSEQTVTPETPAEYQMNLVLAWTVAGIVVGLALLPILQVAFPVWQRRTQWAAFASDVSLNKATSMFPFAPVLLSMLVGYVVDRLWPGKGNPSPISIEVRWLWWSAMLGPWLLAWSLTATGVAPVFHQRFVFASALPLFIVGSIELLRFRHSAARWITAIAVAVAVAFSQGSVSVWQAGYLVGDLRREDWRAATHWVSDRLEPGDQLLCSGGLIEANSSESNPLSLPLNPSFAEYLSFPLLGVYRIVDQSGQSIPVTPLLGDHRRWAAQVVELLVAAPDQTQRLWLVYRGNPVRLKTRLSEFLADLRKNDCQLEASEPKQFGRLFVVELIPTNSRNEFE